MYYPYIKSCKKCKKKKLNEEKILAIKQNRPEINTVMSFYHDPQSDPLWYNSLSHSKIGVVFESSDSAPHSTSHA